MADDLDILTLAEAKQAINMLSTNQEQDDQIARQITAVSRIIDDLCGPVVQREVEAELHDGGSSSIYLYQQPVASIDLVREANGSTITTITAVGFGAVTEGYTAPSFEPDRSLFSGELRRRLGGYESAWVRGGSIEVTYTAGRYEDTESVDARFKVAAESILRRLWKREAGTWAQTPTFFEDGDANAGTGFYRVAVPIIDELLAGDRRPLIGIG